VFSVYEARIKHKTRYYDGTEMFGKISLYARSKQHTTALNQQQLVTIGRWWHIVMQTVSRKYPSPYPFPFGNYIIRNLFVCLFVCLFDGG